MRRTGRLDQHHRLSPHSEGTTYEAIKDLTLTCKNAQEMIDHAVVQVCTLCTWTHSTFGPRSRMINVYIWRRSVRWSFLKQTLQSGSNLCKLQERSHKAGYKYNFGYLWYVASLNLALSWCLRPVVSGVRWSFCFACRLWNDVQLMCCCTVLYLR